MTLSSILLLLLGIALVVGPQVWRRFQQGRVQAAEAETTAALLAEEEARRAALPPIRHVDADGTGWRAPPDWHEPYQPDEGQHDMWKREMRLWLWRMANHHEALRCNLRDAGITLRDQWQNAGALLPAGMDLAMAARRLGFLRLAQAAMPNASPSFLASCWEQHEAAAKAQAADQYARCAEVAKTWDPVTRGGPFRFDTEEQTLAMLTFGAFDVPPTVPPGREVQPLIPFQALTEAGDWRAHTRQVG
jgi:hypothetical protein